MFFTLSFSSRSTTLIPHKFWPEHKETFSGRITCATSSFAFCKMAFAIMFLPIFGVSSQQISTAKDCIFYGFILKYSRILYEFIRPAHLRVAGSLPPASRKSRT